MEGFRGAGGPFCAGESVPWVWTGVTEASNVITITIIIMVTWSVDWMAHEHAQELVPFRSGRHRSRGPARGSRRMRRRPGGEHGRDRKSTRLNSSHVKISYAVFCLKKKRAI